MTLTLRAKIAGLILALIVASPTILTGIFVVSDANAQSASRVSKQQYCAELEGELARLQRAKHSRSNRNFQKIDAAVHKQQAQLDRANQLAKRDNCSGGRGFLFRRTPKATCPALIKRIDKMKRNLASLERKRSKFAPAPQNNGQEKARLLRQLGNAQCGEQYDRFARAEPVRERRGLFGKIFRSRETRLNRQWTMQEQDIPEVGTYRTVCVRACDGYFFPISFSTTQGSFDRDENLCQARCPGTDVGLYIYQNPGETPDDMRSLSGRPYVSLDTAFLYQKEYVPNCSCQAPKSQLASVAGDTARPLSQGVNETANPALGPNIGNVQAPSAPSGPTVPLPMPKQSAMIDPDTRAAERLGVPFTPYKPPEVRSDKGVVRTADGRSIRIVGPKFFGSQE